MNPTRSAIVLATACVVVMTAGVSSTRAADAPTTAPAAEATLVVYPQFAAGDFFARNWMKTYPRALAFTPDKPASITKEPTYQGAPVYATFQFGDADDHTQTVLAIDDTANRAYLDANQNGDLTDDPRISWDMNLNAPKPSTQPSTQPTPKEQQLSIAVPGNWKTGPGKFGVKFFRMSGNTRGFYTPIGAPAGSIELEGHAYNLFLYDQLGKGVYNIHPGKKDLGTVVYIDEDGDGTWKPIGSSESAGLGEPIQLGSKWYEFEASADGRHVQAIETAAPPVKATHPFIAVGQTAPDFTIIMPDGTQTKLSDRKGKVVLLDFWATWCGPCLAAMPKVEALHQKTKDDPKIEVIGLCVMDQPDAFASWFKQNKGTFTFTIGRDVPGQGDESSLAAQAYGLSAIPTTLVITPDGKVVEVVSGFTPENEQKVIDDIRKAGVTVP